MGEVTVEFNKEIFIPKNYSTFNNSILELSIIASGSHYNIEKLNFSWVITDFTS